MKIPIYTLCLFVAASGQKFSEDPVSAGAVSGVSTAFHFGDSISFGGGASNPAVTGWVAELGRMRGWPYSNYAAGGDLAADQAVFVMGHEVAPHSVSFYALGRNDGATYGIDTAKMQDFSAITLGNLAWLAMSAKTAVVYSGAGWKPSGYWATDNTGRPQQFSIASCAAGDEATAIVTGSSVAYVEIPMVKDGIGQVSILVDGSDIGRTINAFPASSSTLPTVPNNRSGGVAPQLIRIPGIDPHYAHRIQVVVTAGCPAVDWIGGNGDAANRPVMALGIAKTGSDNASVAAFLNGELSAYNSLIQAAVRTLAGDGLNVHFVDVWPVLVWPQDFCPGACDGTHPNDAGHLKLAQAVDAFLSTLNPRGKFGL